MRIVSREIIVLTFVIIEGTGTKESRVVKQTVVS